MLAAADCEYALGDAIALGYWAEPRGTLNVDVTLFIAADKPSECVRLLQQIGCEVQSSQAIQSITEHGFCQVEYAGRRLDIFLPIVPFCETARQRRKKVMLGDQELMIWDAETLCVFKLMFFRRKDMADLEQLLRVQADHLDRDWIFQEISKIYGSRDPRVSQWLDLVREVG